jgi:hypothetical protein
MKNVFVTCDKFWEAKGNHCQNHIQHFSQTERVKHICGTKALKSKLSCTFKYGGEKSIINWNTEVLISP